MNRRDFLKAFATIAAAVGLPQLPPPQSAPQSDAVYIVNNGAMDVDAVFARPNTSILRAGDWVYLGADGKASTVPVGEYPIPLGIAVNEDTIMWQGVVCSDVNVGAIYDAENA